MKENRNRITAAIALLIGALIGVILGLFFEPDISRRNRPSQE